MHITVPLSLHQAYYEEFYEQYFLYTMKYRKYNPFLGLFYLAGGLFMGYLFLQKSNFYSIFFALLLLGVGIRTLLENKIARKKWIKKRVEDIQEQSTTVWIFEEEQLHQKSQLAESSLQWSIIQSAQETEKGIFLKLDKASSIYFPKANFSKEEDIEALLRKLEQVPITTVKRFQPK